jgi:hypothetical protein
MRAAAAAGWSILLAACSRPCGPNGPTFPATTCDGCDAGGGPGVTADGGVDGGQPARHSPILDENRLAGGSGWSGYRSSAVLAVYVDRTSYLPGDTVAVHAGAAGPISVSWEVWRLGYYGGTGGRKLLGGGPTPVPAWTPAVLDPATGAVSAQWPATFTFTVPATAVTGVYVLKLEWQAEYTFATFVVREPAPAAQVLYPVSTNTYQAYNAWGGTSLYANRRGDWGPRHAFAVSFDRPYQQEAGTGDLWDKDRDFLTFVEGQGYDIAYVTDADLDAHPELVAGRRMLVVHGHSEYWTAAMRGAVEAAIASGVNVAFFGANTCYWQARFDHPDHRLLVSYKEYAALDPIAATDPRRVTAQWRDPRVGRPENAMVGEMYGEWLWFAAPLVVEDAASWVWTGSGVQQGAAIPGVYDDETDRRFDNSAQPAGLDLIADGFVEGFGPHLGVAETTLYVAPSGAQVFAAGSIHWSRALAGQRVWDARIQQAVANIFSRFAGDGTLGPAAMQPLLLLPGPLPPVYRPGVQVSTVTAALTAPAAVAAAGDGAAIIADGDRIVRVAPDGTLTVIAGSSPGSADGPAAQATFRGPRGVAVARNGSIFVSDSGNLSIRVISAGVVRTLAGGVLGFADGNGTHAMFALPMGIALTPGGQLLVADSRNNRLRVVDAAGNVGTWAGTGAGGVSDGPGASAQLSLPHAVAVLPSGDAVIAEASTGLLRRVSAAPTHDVSDLAGQIGRTGWDDGPLATAALSETVALAVRADQIVLVDSASSRVRALRGQGIDTLAGGAGVGTLDGAGASATFGFPRAAAVAPDGSIYVVDVRAHSLRRIVVP